MALNFPTNPTPGQIHSESGKAWQWSGTSWDFFSNSIPSSSYSNYSISSTAAVSASYALNSNTSNTSSYADYSFNSTSASYALSSSQTCFIGNNNACIAINNPGNTLDGSNVVISAGDSNNCSVCIGCVSIRAGNSNSYCLSGGDINIISGCTGDARCKNGNINLTAGAGGINGLGGNINICSPGTGNTSGVVEIRSGNGNSGGSIVVCGDQGAGAGSGGVSISAGNDLFFFNSQASVDITTYGGGGGRTGNLNFHTGESYFGGVGDINIYTGNSQYDMYGPPGNINICACKAGSTGGNIILNTSTGMCGNGGNITLCASVPFASSAVLNLKSDGTAAITATAGMSICTCGNGVCDENGHRFVVATTVPVTNGTYCLTGSITVVNGIITAIT